MKISVKVVKGGESTARPAAEREEWLKMGMPHVDAPTGGRCMSIRSWDQGRTWSRPQTLIDTPAGGRSCAASSP
ncbi:MAG: hypothetical protein EXS58_17815 [Candidatus Latescibacteria bacterium]|nr:hypothetical protein [Candidatus Latescibacterota bacterium]